jgi:hypothetical protein
VLTKGTRVPRRALTVGKGPRATTRNEVCIEALASPLHDQRQIEVPPGRNPPRFCLRMLPWDPRDCSNRASLAIRGRFPEFLGCAEDAFTPQEAHFAGRVQCGSNWKLFGLPTLGRNVPTDRGMRTLIGSELKTSLDG